MLADVWVAYESSALFSKQVKPPVKTEVKHVKSQVKMPGVLASALRSSPIRAAAKASRKASSKAVKPQQEAPHLLNPLTKSTDQTTD